MIKNPPFDPNGAADIATLQADVSALQTAVGAATYETGTFTATATTGFTTTPSATFNYAKFGNLVIISPAGAISGTSNAGTFVITGVPAAIRPAAPRYAFATTADNGGASGVGFLGVNADGSIDVFRDLSATAFTAAGTKTLGPLGFSYTL